MLAAVFALAGYVTEDAKDEKASHEPDAWLGGIEQPERHRGRSDDDVERHRLLSVRRSTPGITGENQGAYS